MMFAMDLAARIALLRELHAPAHRPLVLCNVWDAASARIVEDAGFAAVATSSAGVAYSLGYADGERLPPREMFAAVERIVSAVKVPVTADVEAGYGDLKATLQALRDAGAAGLNLEDMEDGRLVPLEEQAGRVSAARAAGLVVNARIDIYLAQVGDAGSRFDRTVERMRAFAAAGADCVFVPGVRDETTIAALVNAANVPLNVLAVAGVPPIARLRQLGVGRVSTGSGPMRATMALVAKIASELRNKGTYEGMTAETIPYPLANALFTRGRD